MADADERYQRLAEQVAGVARAAASSITTDSILQASTRRRHRGLRGQRPAVRIAIGVFVAALVVAGVAFGVTRGGSTRPSAGFGTVCGYEVFVGGPSDSGPTTPPPDVARQCPPRSASSGDAQQAVTITGAGGTIDVVYPTDGSSRWLLWSAVLPAGTYSAVGWACSGPGQEVVVTAGRTLRSVRIAIGCLVP